MRPIGLEAGDVPARVAVAGAVELDLPIDLGTVEDRALDDVMVVDRETMLDGGEVRHRAAHSDDALGRGPPVQWGEVDGDRIECRGERRIVDDPVQAISLRQPNRTDVQAEGLVDAVPVANREL